MRGVSECGPDGERERATNGRGEARRGAPPKVGNSAAAKARAVVTRAATIDARRSSAVRYFRGGAGDMVSGLNAL